MATIQNIDNELAAAIRPKLNANFNALKVEVEAATTAVAAHVAASDPHPNYALESDVTSALAGKAAAASGVHTGTTSVQVLSPTVADLGTVSSGTVTLSSTHAENKVILSGSSAAIALPASPPNGRRLLHVTTTGGAVVTVGLPSLIRANSGSNTPVSSVQLPASSNGRATFAFYAEGGSYTKFELSGDAIRIEGPQIAWETDPDATPSNTSGWSTQATAQAIADAVAGVEVGSVSFAPVPLAALDINGSLATFGPFTKTITTNTTLTRSNFVEGREYILDVINTGSYTLALPIDAWTDNTAPSPIIATGSVRTRYALCEMGGVCFGRVVGKSWPVDTTAPTVSSSAIDVTGGFIDITLSEDGRVGIGGNGGFALSTGEVLTFVSVTDDVIRYSILPLVASTATPTLAYTQPGNGIEDLLGNDLASFSGATIANGSGYNPASYLIKQNFETPTTGYDNGESGVWSNLGTTVDPVYTTTALKGSQSLAISVNNANARATFTGFSDGWAHARIRTTSLPSSSSTLFALRDSSANLLCGLRVGSGTVRLYANGGDSATSVSMTWAVNTTYYVWLHFDDNGGTCELCVSTSSTRPSADSGGNCYLTRASAAGSATADRVYCQRSTSGGTIIFDNVLVSVGAIGNNPNP